MALHMSKGSIMVSQPRNLERLINELHHYKKGEDMMKKAGLEPVRTIVHILFILAILISSASRADASTKRALLIGIDDYKAPHISDLRGCVNDAELMRTVLVGKFNVPPENILMLTNGEATHSGIVDAIRNHLIAETSEGDIVILHYSGHGSQMKDTSNDEIDNYDETLVPHDSRTEGIFDISDDEINGLLKQLTEKTKNVTFIFDSCHSGAGARNGNTVRRIEPDLRTPPAPASFAVSTRGAEGETDLRLENSDYVLISGSLANELSNEAIFEGERHGALTWYLAANLLAAPENTTYRDVMDQVRAEVSTRFPTQHPQIEGPGQDLVVFGTDKINVKPYVLVNPLESGKVQVEAGKVYGLGKDSIVKVYPPRTADFAGTEPVASVKIMNVNDFDATAEIIEGGPVQPQSRGLLEAVSFGDTAIPVFIEKKDGPLADVKAALRAMPSINLVEDETGARLSVADVEGEFLIRSGDLELLVPPVPASQENAASHIIDQMKDIIHWMVILDLKNPESKIKLGFDVWRTSDPHGTPAPRTVPSGTEISYRVENNSPSPLYIYVLDVSSDGSVALLYPRGEQQQLPAGEDFERHLRMSVPEGHSAVTDVLKVLATVKPIDPSVFPQGSIRSAPKAGARAAQDPLARFLAGAMRGERAAVDITFDPDTWATTQKPLIIKQDGVKVSSFSFHFDTKKNITDVRDKLAESRALCPEGAAPGTGDCDNLASFSRDETVLEFIPGAATREAEGEAVSVGRAFEEAYHYQDLTQAKRVEPMLEIQVPGAETEHGIDKRDVSGDDQHDPAAESDDEWSLKQIRVFEAWEKIRNNRNVAEGEEADGILIAHPDTGYRHHPETWNEFDGKRPINSAMGRNYYEGGTDAFDPLLDDRLLDNPGHGTASGSVIVSPAGCQLPDAPACVNGIARGAQLIPLRVHRTVSQFNTRNLAKAIQDVADGQIAGNPHLISIAMGGPPTFSMWKAVKSAEKNGILIVAAAGNYVRTVVWPARFSSTIAVAAGNVRCQPWKNSSRGSAVDIMAPGESVWRATLNKNHEHINGMGKGTTFATGNVAGAAALWLAAHQDDPALQSLAAQGLVTRAFRSALRASSWHPSADQAVNPPGTHCEPSTWDSDYGAGILDTAGLLEVPLSETQPRSARFTEEETIPLFASLFPEGTDPELIRAAYLSLFAPSRGGNLDELSSFETEILYHYTVNEEVQRKIDALIAGQRGGEPAEAIRRALARQDLSGRLREALGQ